MLAEEDSNTGTGARRGGKTHPPLTQHPLFPATIAIWFGALFGLGSLAIRPSLLEEIVVASRIDMVFSAAAPPLGMTARILLALVMAGTGGLLGALLARRVGRPKQELRERQRGASSVLGKQVPAGDTGRRRALAIAEEPRDEFEDRAPLPGGAPQILNVRDVDPDPSAMVATASAKPAEATAAKSVFHASKVQPTLAIGELDLGEFDDEPVGSGPAPRFSPYPITASAQPRFSLGPIAAGGANVGFPASAPVDAEAARPAPSARATEFVARVTAHNGPAMRLFDAPPTAPVPVAEDFPSDPSERDDHGSESVTEAVDDPAPLDDFASVAESDGPSPATAPDDENEAQATIVSAMTDATAAERIASADLGVLSQVELLERLALAMRARRDRRDLEATATQADCELPPVEPVAQPEPLDPVPAPPITTQLATAPCELPAALRPVAIDDVEDDDAVPAFVPARHIAMPAPTAPSPAPQAVSALELAPAPEEEEDLDIEEQQEEADEENRALEEGYSSLLNLSRPATAQTKQQFVRIEEPEADVEAIEPVVVFPGQTPRPSALSARVDAPAAPLPAVGARRFDAPGVAAASGYSAAAPQNPEETERALRAALASLQRMSGAA